MINDAHCHFFSTPFVSGLARQRGRNESASDILRELGWDDPRGADALADRWIAELDANGVQRAAIIASMPADEESVAAAVSRHPQRLVGFAMLDPSAADAVSRARRAVSALAVRGICLFPAMHRVPLDDDRTLRVVEVAAEHAGTAVFVHCGVLTVGVRRTLGLQSPFDLRLGDPIAVSRLALAFPRVPFIIPHFGAGLFREALMAADVCANVYLDTSSSNGWIKYSPGLSLADVFKAALSVAGASRLLFGTDSSFFPRGWQKTVFDAQTQAFAAVAHSAADEALVFGGNLDRLFPS